MTRRSAPKTGFHVRKAEPEDGEVLFDIWWRSVCATHTFLTADDLQALAPLVRELGLANLDTWVLCAAATGPVGFLVLSGCAIEALFIAPEWLRRGGGTLLIAHARSLRGRLTVDVNEQNAAAVKFYLARRFSIRGRSETDSAGRPFPLLHLAEELDLPDGHRN